MSSIDDEFASLFLPDLELINSVSNANAGVNNMGSAVEENIEEMQTTPITMNNLDSDTFNPNENYSDRNGSGAHWLHHYGKLGNTYGLLLNQLQQPYAGYNNAQQMLLSQIQGPSLFNESAINSMMMNNAEFMNFQRQPDMTDYGNTGFTPNETSMKNTVQDDSYPNVEREPSPVQSSQLKPTVQQLSVKKKKETSSQYSYLLTLQPEIVDEHVSLFDLNNNKINFQANGEIDGRFLFTEADLQDQATTRISCYRRNFIQISFNFGVDNIPKFVSTANHNKAIISGFKVLVHATTNFSDDKIDLLVFDNDGKKNSADPDTIYMGGSVHVFGIQDGQFNQKFCLKKTQFRNATPNNGKSTIFQNYYYIMVSVCATTQYNGDIPLINLKSIPIKVRGRNPSFYNDRNDILIIKGSGSSQIPKQNDATIKLELPRSHIPIASEVPTNSLQTPNVYSTIPTRKPSQAVLPSSKEKGQLPAIRESQSGSSTPSSGSKTPSNYEYFPLSNVYYLPPLDAHYFPHGVHHPRQSSIARNRRQSSGQDDKTPRSDELQNRTSDTNNNGNNKLAPGKYIKMKLMNILNNDNSNNNNNNSSNIATGNYYYDPS